MNERIKELAKQADQFAYAQNPEQDAYGRSANPRKFQQDRDTKFAELIVLECAIIVGSMEEPHQDIAKLVRQHFGIKG